MPGREKPIGSTFLERTSRRNFLKMAGVATITPALAGVAPLLLRYHHARTFDIASIMCYTSPFSVVRYSLMGRGHKRCRV